MQSKAPKQKTSSKTLTVAQKQKPRVHLPSNLPKAMQVESSSKINNKKADTSSAQNLRKNAAVTTNKPRFPAVAPKVNTNMHLKTKPTVHDRAVKVDKALSATNKAQRRSVTTDANKKIEPKRHVSVSARPSAGTADLKTIKVTLEPKKSLEKEIIKSNRIEVEPDIDEDEKRFEDNLLKEPVSIDIEVINQTIKDCLGTKPQEGVSKVEESVTPVATDQAMYTKSKLSGVDEYKDIEVEKELSPIKEHSQPLPENNNEVCESKKVSSLIKGDKIMFHTDSKLLARNQNKAKTYTDGKKHASDEGEWYAEFYQSKKINANPTDN